ncbi:MAG: NADP-dependent isocitrate dehydrogenase [Streptococcaceae bacterium]|jgi:isocitrate dehydrogenase|nr:NADP-dependent isocitrate dehydrogenase [Streptococcaceae bacterium]
MKTIFRKKTMKITMQNGALQVPENPTIGYIPGDGIGQDIFPVAKKVLDAAVRRAYAGKRAIDWQKLLAGGETFEATGDYLPAETLDFIQENLLAIKGPLMTPVGEGFRSINVTLRQKLDLFACVRPVEYFPGIEAPVKHPEKVNITIFRENTEDIYAGIEFASGTAEARKLQQFLQNELGVTKIRFPETSALGVKPVSPDGTKRLVRAAFDYALVQGKTKVTFVHKGNIMKFTEGGFRKWAYEVQAEDAKYANLQLNDVIADNFLQQILLNPQKFEVVATLNLNGDYVSDALAAQVGGIGIAPGANINYTTGHAIFEATHGTAPDIAGKNIANPSSLLLSGVMMLDYLGWHEAASLVKTSLAESLAAGEATTDIGGSLSTADFGKILLAKI